VLFGQIGFNCPNDGQVHAGFDAVEDMVVHEEGQTEISVRCPKCGTLVRIASMAPLIPPNIVEQLAQELNVQMKDGKLNFSDLMSHAMGGMSGTSAMGGVSSFGFESDDYEPCDDCQNLEELADRELSLSEGNQVEFFARELEKIESVDEFLSRVSEDKR